MITREAADHLHRTLFAMRKDLERRGGTGSTILAAEATLAHLLPLLLEGKWRGTCDELAARCGRSPVSIRRSLRALEKAGLLRSRALGRHGIELVVARDLSAPPPAAEGDGDEVPGRAAAGATRARRDAPFAVA